MCDWLECLKFAWNSGVAWNAWICLECVIGLNAWSLLGMCDWLVCDFCDAQVFSNYCCCRCCCGCVVAAMSPRSRSPYRVRLAPARTLESRLEAAAEASMSAAAAAAAASALEAEAEATAAVETAAAALAKATKAVEEANKAAAAFAAYRRGLRGLP